MSTKKKKRGKIPERQCINCGRQRPKSELLRIVERDTSEVREYDETGRVRGRGAYLCRERNCIEDAVRNGIITEDEASQLLQGMKKHSLSLLSIAAKAGKLASGEFQCEAAISEGKACGVIITDDASDNTKKKFIKKAGSHDIPYIIYGEMEEIGRLIGKEDRSCVAVMDEGLAKQILDGLGSD